MKRQSIPLINHFSALIKLETFNSDSQKFIDAVEDFIARLHLHVVQKLNYRFEPIGKTLVYILSESHLAIHAWPELKLFHLDLVSCSPIEKKNMAKAIELSFSKFEIKSLLLKQYKI